MKQPEGMVGRFMIPGLLSIGLLALVFLPNLNSGFGNISFSDVLFLSYVGDSQFYLLLALAGVELALVSSLLLEDARLVLRRRLVVGGAIVGLFYPLGLLVERVSISDFGVGLFVYGAALVAAAVLESGVNIGEATRSLTVPSGKTSAWKDVTDSDWAIVKTDTSIFSEPSLDSDTVTLLATGASLRIVHVSEWLNGERWVAVSTANGRHRGYVEALNIELDR